MTFEYGDMWSAFDEADLFCITTNSSIKQNGNLVMGAGIAGQAASKYPKLPERLGEQIKQNGSFQAGEPYGLVHDPASKIAAYQTKEDWQEDSSMQVIAHSHVELFHWLFDHPGAVVHMNYPGIGHGGLPKETVQPLLDELPDRVHVWQYDSE